MAQELPTSCLPRVHSKGGFFYTHQTKGSTPSAAWLVADTTTFSRFVASLLYPHGSSQPGNTDRLFAIQHRHRESKKMTQIACNDLPAPAISLGTRQTGGRFHVEFDLG